MESKANAKTVGAFILAVIIGLLAFVFWASRLSEGRNQNSYDIMFDGSVSGLVKGSSVLFNGIRVGAVTDMRLNPADPRQVIARVSVETTTPIRQDSRISLEYQGITGSAAISMRGGASTSPLVPVESGRTSILYAESSAVQDLMQAARSMMGKADGILERVDKFVVDVQNPLTKSTQNVEKFTGALGDNTENITSFLKETSDAAKKLGLVAERADKMVAKLDLILEAVDPKTVKSTVSNIDTFTTSMAAQTTALAGFIFEARGVAKTLDTALTDLNRITTAVDTAKVTSTINNLETFTNALGKNATKVDEMIVDASKAAKQLSSATDTAQSLMKGFDINAKGGFLDELNETSKSIRLLASKLDKRTVELTGSLTAFTNKGIREMESLVVDGKRALTQVERSLKSLESNPQRLIFGGSDVKEYRR